MCKFENLVIECGGMNPPGLRTKLYFIPAAELVGFPKTKDKMTPAGTAIGDTVTIGEAFTMVTTAGKGFFRTIDVVVDTAGLMSKTVGEVLSKSFENSLKFFVMGTSVAALEFAECVANSCLVCLVQDREDNFFVIGRNNDPAHVESIEINWGEKQGDRKGSAYEIKSLDGRVPLLYPASLTIDVTPAV
jgi:hypothetical protein